MPEKLYLLDGYAMLYRAHFAFINNPLINSRGENTSAVFGTVLSLKRILDECRPDYIAMVFDSKEPTFRHERYKEYKATREKMPEDMRSQIPWARKLIEEAFRIPVLEMPGYEADDIIGSMCRIAEKNGVDTVIVSGDKDFYQLINGHVSLYTPRGRGEDAEIVTLANADERLGVPPEQVIDYLALVGDSADNVPGVKGIGKVTAVKLLTQFRNLEEVYDGIDDIKQDSVRKKLLESRDNAVLSKELVTIVTGLDLEFSPEKLKAEDQNLDVLEEIFDRLEFRTLKSRFGLQPGREHKAAKKDYRLVGSLGELDGIIEKISAAGRFAVDTETTALDPMQAELVGVSLAWEPDRAYYIPVAHKQKERNLPRAEVLGRLKKILGETGNMPESVGQNIKYDFIVLARSGLKIGPPKDDPMLASYILDPGQHRHNLDYLADILLEHKMIKYGDVTGKGKSQVTFDEVDVDTACKYAAEDADVTLQIADKLVERFEDEPELEKLYREVELPLINVLARMEMTGVALDQPYLETLSGEMGEKLVHLEAKAHELAGHEFNLASTQQLATVLFEEKGIPPGKKTKTGYSTDSSVLESLADEHELPRVVLEYREIAKLKSTYVDALPLAVNAVTGRVHTSFNQIVAATGRLSSQDPNLQNIPIRTEEGRKIRRAFIPSEPGRVLISADYSQIELRMLAHLCGDPAMIEAFSGGVDIHTQTASRLFGVMPENVTVEHRSRAKTINFGVLYGMSAHRLSRELKIPFREAKKFIDDYFDRFPNIREWIEEQKEHARRKGWVSTILGRKRWLPEIKSANRVVRENSERIALNTPIQGSAADLIKLAMLNIDKRLAREFPDSHMIIQVHDELIFDVPVTSLDKVGAAVKQEMEGAMDLSVPIKVELGSGKNWLECK